MICADAMKRTQFSVGLPVVAGTVAIAIAILIGFVLAYTVFVTIC